MLIELGRQIPKQLHSEAMHGRFHLREGNAVREHQSMKPTSHQAILVHNRHFPTSKISADGGMVAGLAWSRQPSVTAGEISGDDRATRLREAASVERNSQVAA